MKLKLVGTLDEIPGLIAEAAASQKPLSQAAAVLPTSAMAHQVKVAAGGLPGVQFLSVQELAALVLLRHGEPARPTGQAYWPLALEAVIASPALEKKLRYFQVEQLRRGPGYAEALASTLGELDAAGLGPADIRSASTRLARETSPAGALAVRRLHDLAQVWETFGQEVGADLSGSAHSIVRRASQVLSGGIGRYPFSCPTLAWVDERTPNVSLEFLARIPDVTAIFMPALPMRPELAARLRHIARLLGLPQDALAVVPEARTPGRDVREMDRVKAGLFRAPGEAKAGKRDKTDARGQAASRGPVAGIKAEKRRGAGGQADGSLHLEEHAGVEDELQAAVAWVSLQVFEHRRPLEQIALLLPSLDPYAQMLVERLSALPWSDRGEWIEPPVHVAGGLPATSTSAGARALALLDALDRSLDAASIARLLPSLILPIPLQDAAAGSTPAESGSAGILPAGGPGSAGILPPGSQPLEDRLTHAEAMELAYECGTLGGLAGREEAALEWAEAVRRRQRSLADRIEAVRQEAADPDESRHARELKDMERLLGNLAAATPALEELVSLYRTVLDGQAIAAVWKAMQRFVKDFMRLPPGPVDVLGTLELFLGPLLASALGGRIRGRTAVRVLHEALRSVRYPVGRFGEPRITIGRLPAAAGLSFQAVRVLGVTEGALPSRPGVDPILPDRDREALEPAEGLRAIPMRTDGPLEQLCAFYRVVHGVAGELVLSAPRQSVERTVKELSGLFLEVATAAGRAMEEGARRVPSARELRRAYFTPAREALARSPCVTEEDAARAVAARTSRGPADIPASWLERGRGDRNLERIGGWMRAGRAGHACELDGLFPPGWPLPALPGLAPGSPVSASRLKRLLDCPHWFLFQDVLGWEEAAAALPTREIGQPAYGGLLHLVAEIFFRGHGKAFTARSRSLSDFEREASEVAAHAFEEFLREYPLIGPAQEEQRRRLERDFLRLLRYEWNDRPGLEFVGVELPFGFDHPVALELSAGQRLYARGYIDRLDTAGGKLVIRDIKSGKAHPRLGGESGPTPDVDVQLVLYALVAEALRRTGRKSWPEVGQVAYVYPDVRSDTERAFSGDLPDLLEQGRSWLGLGVSLLEARTFPRTVRKKDCRYCPFRPVCGPDAPDAASRRLAAAKGPVESFVRLKTGAIQNLQGSKP